MPTPRPMKRHRARSRLLPWSRRGYQTSGTANVRPSSSWTVSSSSVTLTSTARAARGSLVEVGIPAPQQRFSVLLNQPLNPANLNRLEATAALEANGAPARTWRCCHLARHERAVAPPRRSSRRGNGTGRPATPSASIHPIRRLSSHEGAQAWPRPNARPHRPERATRAPVRFSALLGLGPTAAVAWGGGTRYLRSSTIVMERGIPGRLVINPRRSNTRTIWFTEGADTRKCRPISDSAGETPYRRMYRAMNSR